MLNITRRTINNCKENRKALHPIEGEHLLKLIALFELGESIFGNLDEFNCWLKKPFGDYKDTPFDLLNTSGGIDLVVE